MKALALALTLSCAAAIEPPRQLGEQPPALAELLRTAYAEAQQQANAALDAEARADAWGRLGVIYHGQRLYALAEDAYRTALDEAESTRWRYLYAIVFSERGDIERATANFRRVVEAEPDNATARYRLGVALLLGGDLAGAETQLEAAHKTLPDSALVLAALADLATARDDAQTALALLERAWKIEPEAGQLAYKLAMAERRLGNVEVARQWLKRQPDNSLAPSIDDPLLLEVARTSRSARFYEAAADWALARGDQERAIDALRNAVVLAPEDATLGLRLARLLAQTGEAQDALAETRRVLEADPESAPAWHLLAWLLRKSYDAAQVEQAVRAVSRSLAQEDDAAARTLAAALAMRQRRYEDAAAHYERLAQAHQTQAPYRYWLGLAQLGAGRCAGRAAVREALRLRPNWGEAHLVLARADAVCGEVEAALRRAAALRNANDDAQTRLALAFALFHAGRAEQAKQLATAELPHPDARLILDATNMPLPVFASESPWWLPSEVR